VPFPVTTSLRPPRVLLALAARITIIITGERLGVLECLRLTSHARPTYMTGNDLYLKLQERISSLLRDFKTLDLAGTPLIHLVVEVPQALQRDRIPGLKMPIQT
jgi:hypothetical protein